MPAFQDAFISYGRADSKAFAIALKEQLRVRGLGNIWLDQDDIPAATDWQQRIDEAIERSHHFIYVISPSAMASPYCKLELSLARQYGKRIVPVLHVAGDSKTWATIDPEGCATVRLLNWIWCRDGVDEAEQYLEKLTRTLSYCDEQTGAEQPHIQAYVHQHTTLLTQALSWQRHHRQTRYLLVGTDRQAAETWLQTRPADGQPLPCTPTDLHCEYITESTKNASNLMTQVFLCHSDQDRDTAEQIRRSLLRQGITVWNYRTDIQTSQDYPSAIAQGIEEADNVVFVLSPHSAQSPYCQQELAQALTLNKRVIPVLAAAVEPDLVPEGLRTLQHIDLTDNTQASDYAADESQLLRQLNTDAAYHTEHKTWLVQALKWQRQQQNPTLLLRGYNLRRAETWLKVARTHRHPPTALHEQLIAESLRQPPNPALDVFISYSRVDSDFARRLNDALQTQGKRTWFDQESIATGTDFQQEIYRGIESSDVFVFVLSPESVNSPFCADEVEYAQGLNKRMVTVLHRPIDTADLHPVLAKLQWLDFREHDGDFQANFAGLLRTLDTDREHLETHTRLLVRSGEWDRRGRDESLLLRGQDLARAEDWIKTNAAVEPQPTGLQQEYIRAGRARQEAQDAAEKKLRRGARTGALAAAAGILVAASSGLGAWLAIQIAYERTVQANTRVAEANTQVDKATQQAREATRQTQQAKHDQQKAQASAKQAAQAQQTAETRAREADGKAQAAAVAQQRAEASAQAAAAKAQDAEVRASAADVKTAEAEKAQMLAQNGTRLEQAGVAALNRLDFDSVGALLNALKAGKELNEIAAKEGFKAISDYPAASPMLALQQIREQVSNTRLLPLGGISAFNPDATQAVMASADGTARILDFQSGQSTPLKGHTGSVASANFSSDGTQVVTASEDGTVRVWDLQSGHLTSLEGHTSLVYSVSFSPDGTQVVTASEDHTARVGDLRSGQSTLLAGHTAPVVEASFSPNGRLVVTASDDHTARVWDLQSGQSITLEGHTDVVRLASFSPDGNQVVTESYDGTVRVWDLQSGQFKSFEGNTSGVYSASFSPDGTHLVTVTALDFFKNEARVWDLQSGQFTSLEGHTASVVNANFSPDGTRVVTASADGTARIWDLQSGQSTPLEGHTGLVTSANFSPDGTQVVTASEDGTVRVWDFQSSQSVPIEDQYDSNFVSSISFSPDGTQVILVSAFGTADVWDLQSGQSSPLEIPHDTTDLGNLSEDELEPLLEAIQSIPEIIESPDTRSQVTTISNDAQVLIRSDEGTVELRDILSGQSAFLESDSTDITHASFSLDGTKAVTVSYGDAVRVWNLQTGQSTILEGHTYRVESISFSLDGKQVVAASGDGTAQVWDLQSGQATLLEGHASIVTNASFSPNGSQVVTASVDGTARVWDLATGDFRILEGHEAGVTSASFSPDGSQVATASVDGTARLWDLQGRQLAIYEGFPAAFSPDGQRMATVVDGRVKVYDIETLPELIAWGCQWLHNYLEYGQATDADRALCNLPPRDPDPAGPFESSLGQAAGLVGVSWPERG